MRCFIWSLLFFVFQFSFLLAQQSKIDSVKNLLKNDKDDTNKVFHLNMLARLYYDKPAIDTPYLTQSIDLAKKIGYKTGIANGYKHFGSVYWIKVQNSNKALAYYFKSADVFNSSGNLTNEALIYSVIGIIYYGVDSFATGLKYEYKALKINEKIKNKSVLAAAYDNIGEGYNSLGDYPGALKYYMNALAVIEQLGDEKRASNCQESIGELYTKIGDNKNAMEYFDSSLTKSRKIGYLPFQEVALMDIADIYKSGKKYKEALEEISEAYALTLKPDDTYHRTSCTELMGEIYYESGDYVKALEYENEALKTASENKFLDVIIQSQGVLGEIYLKQKKFGEAEKYLLAAVASVHGSHELEAEKNYELDLIRLYTAESDFKKVAESYAKYDALRDSLINSDKSRQIGRIEAKAEYDKQLNIKQAEEDKAEAIADAKSKRQQIINLLVTLIAVVVALIALLIYRSWRAAKKENIRVEKEKISMELKALRAQMNPHFIFNAINSVQRSILKNDPDAANRHLTGFSKLIRKVLENSKYETIPLTEEISILKLFVELEYLRFIPKFTYEFQIQENIDADNILITPMLLQAYIENAIWHGLMFLEDRVGKLLIGISVEGDFLKCVIEDNGIGRKLSKELKKDSMHNPMGMTISKEILETMGVLYKTNAKVTVTDRANESGTPIGTRVEIYIPLTYKKQLEYA